MKRSLDFLNAENDSVKYSSSFGKRDVRLFMVTEDILNKITSDDKLLIVGSENNANSVLCTKDSTYSIKKVETSNEVLLIPPSNSSSSSSGIKNENDENVSFDVVARCPDFYELKCITPNFDSIKSILEKTMFMGIDEEKLSPPSAELLKTYDELKSMVLASSLEFQKALDDIGAIEFNDKMRIIAPEAKWDVMSYLLNEITSADLDYVSIDDEDFRNRMTTDGIDYILFENALKTLGKKENGKWCLRGNDISKAVAHCIFNKYKKIYYPQEDFAEDWAIALPRGTIGSKELLDGIVLEVEPNDKIPSLSYIYLPVDKSGSDLASRMKKIFEIKTKLTMTEIKPYIVDIKPDDMTDYEFISSLVKKMDNENFYTLKGLAKAL